MRQAAQYRGVRSRGDIPKTRNQIVPANVLAERERAQNSPRAAAAAMMGDPLPGRSALERGPGLERFRRTDVLDGLRFPG